MEIDENMKNLMIQNALVKLVRSTQDVTMYMITSNDGIKFPDDFPDIFKDCKRFLVISDKENIDDFFKGNEIEFKIDLMRSAQFGIPVMRY